MPKCRSGIVKHFGKISSNSEENDDTKGNVVDGTTVSVLAKRRQVLKNLFSGASSSLIISSSGPSWAEAQRAVGSAEIACREAGNCLETGQLDGAVGWSWGGKDRCDATDPLCGPNGVLLDEPPAGKPVPQVTNKITHVAEIQVDIGKGRDSETDFLRIGFYGVDCPASVDQMVRFLSTGIVSTSSLMFESGMGVISAPLSLLEGGNVPDIVPGKVVDFGVPSQEAAYARSRGMARVKDEFVPQPRPPPTYTQNDRYVRKHDVAGLVSVAEKGLGYGGSGFASADEAFGSSFQITADAMPSLDKAGRRVIGQVVDKQSMAFLARLVSLPTRKGLKGFIPGADSGPPLLRVTIADVSVIKPEVNPEVKPEAKPEQN